MKLHRGAWLLALLLVAPKAQADGSDPFPHVAAAYLIETDGTTVWTHQANRRLPPASLTKIMTALLVLERGQLGETVTVSAAAAAETGHQLRLRAKETWRAEDLLAATLIESANDACRALAEHIAGSDEGFAALMNDRAASLGLKDTHFTNSAGHDHPLHYSTAADLAVLTRVALTHPLFRQLVATKRLDIHPLNSTRVYRMQNNNKLLGQYPGLAGVKTGFTQGAGRCLVALAERDGVEILLVLLRAPNRWNTASRMLDRAFQKVVAGTERKTGQMASVPPGG
jgi:D-alanyl-D-alanine carboxypeptidase (penicillin-binding protein 5/6)